MKHLNIAPVIAGEHRYMLELLNPLEGIAWGNRALTLFGPALGKALAAVDFKALEGLDLTQDGLVEVGAKMQGMLISSFSSLGELDSEKVTAIMTEAIQRCYTPENESLVDQTVFNRWFREYPGDLYPLGVMALYHLVKDFFPKQLVTGASAFLAKTNTTPDSQSPSHSDGRPGQ